MSVVQSNRAARVRACRLDLSRNGIDMDALPVRQLREFVRKHLDYFQLMIGGEPGVYKVVAWLREDRAAQREWTASAAPPGRRSHRRSPGSMADPVAT